MDLRKRLVGLAITGTMLAATLGPGAAFAASDNHTELGTPGDPNCEGQTMAALAQLVQNADATDEYQPGIGNIADIVDLSVKELREIVGEYCAQEV
jgi:hypothetical protein